MRHSHALDRWSHEHVFLGARHERNERRVWLVVALTLVTMLAEIVGGSLLGSIAVVADGWHMGTHAAALGLSGAAYLLARRHRADPRLTFGTGKLGDLAAFASAVALGIVALLIAAESALRLARPVSIAYGEALALAVAGLLVNLVSAWLLGADHGHDHGPGDHGPGDHHRDGATERAEGDAPRGHDHDAGHRHPHAHAHEPAHAHTHAHADGPIRDMNLRAAYLHVLADALTSVLAIAGLLAAWTFGLWQIDPLVGLVGAAVIAVWSIGLIRSSAAVLLDAVPDPELARTMRARLEQAGDRVTDLHLWQVGPGHRAAVVALVSASPRPPSDYKALLADLPGLCHVTVEVTAAA